MKGFRAREITVNDKRYIGLIKRKINISEYMWHLSSLAESGNRTYRENKRFWKKVSRAYGGKGEISIE